MRNTHINVLRNPDGRRKLDRSRHKCDNLRALIISVISASMWIIFILFRLLQNLAHFFNQLNNSKIFKRALPSREKSTDVILACNQCTTVLSRQHSIKSALIYGLLHNISFGFSRNGVLKQIEYEILLYIIILF